MDCDKIEAAEIAEKYVTGSLGEAERTDFEIHFLGCQRCFEQVRLWQDLQTALPRRPRREWRWFAVLPVAASLLAVAGLTWFRTNPVAKREASRTTVSARPTLDLTALAAVVPPRYTQPQWRAAGPTVFDVAMQRYSRGDYSGATPDLVVAAKSDPSNAAAAFFLGICYLIESRDDDAIAQLKTTIALGDSPELEEAHFYLAKALLRKRDLSGALAEFRLAEAMHGPRQAEERSLIEKITQGAPPPK
jgi:tetratricopeptide (TPR) repeat protein